MKEFNDHYRKVASTRYRKTLDFLKNKVSKSEVILDLGPPNPLSEIMRNEGFQVFNTQPDVDLDFDFSIVKDEKFDVVTAFEVLEHMVSPFPLLCKINAKKLLASVPLRYWFKSAYWNENDPYDRHFHEFEPRQFDMLLLKSGWEIKSSEKWISKTQNIGIRPLLRNITPRYYIVYCERKEFAGFK